MLEGKIKRMKNIAPKGCDSQKMWQKIGRSLDDITSISENLNKALKLYETDGERNEDLAGECIATEKNNILKVIEMKIARLAFSELNWMTIFWNCQRSSSIADKSTGRQNERAKSLKFVICTC